MSSFGKLSLSSVGCSISFESSFLNVGIIPFINPGREGLPHGARGSSWTRFDQNSEVWVHRRLCVRNQDDGVE